MSGTQRDQRPRGRLWFFLLFAPATALEAGAVAVACQGTSPVPGLGPWTAALILHLLAAGVLLPSRPGPKSAAGKRRFYPCLAALLTLFLPAVGLAGVFLAMIVSRSVFHRQGLAKEFVQHSIIPEDEVEMEEVGDVSTFLREELSTEPLLDILNGSDIELKRGAVNLLRRLGSAEAVRLLRKSLSDPSTEVRYFAHTALARLEADFSKRLERAERAARKGSFEALCALGRAYRDYALSELPEGSIRENAVLQARRALEKALAMQPDNLRLRLETAQLSLSEGDHRAARDYFQQAMQDPDLAPASALGLLRAFFETRDWPALAGLIKDIGGMTMPPGTDPLTVIHLKFWSTAEGWSP